MVPRRIAIALGLASVLASAPAGAQDEVATAKAERRTFTIELVPLEQGGATGPVEEKPRSKGAAAFWVTGVVPHPFSKQEQPVQVAPVPIEDGGMLVVAGTF